MELWPPALQELINEEGFRVTLGNTVVRSDNDTGSAKVRSRYTDGIDQYDTTIYLDYSLLTTFLSFFKTTLVNGTLTFGYDDPITGSEAEFRFMEPPTIVPRGGRAFTVNMRWEKMG